MSDQQIVDFGYLEELSGGDAKYKYELLNIFLSTTPEGVNNLKGLVNDGKDFEAMYKQAHALKSSVGVVKISGVHEGMKQIEALARAIHEGKANGGIDEIRDRFSELLVTFNEAVPLLEQERDKNKPPEVDEE